MIPRSVLAPILLAAFAFSAQSQELTDSDEHVYETDADGRVISPHVVSSSEAGKLVSLFERHPPSSFARAENLYSFVRLGHGQYLATTSDSLPAANGVFLANLRADSLQQLVGDYEVKESHRLAASGEWFLFKSSGGRHGVGGTVMTAVTVSRTRHNTVVRARDLVTLKWDMVSGLCGRMKDGVAGDIGSYSVVQADLRPQLSINVTEQDCRTRETRRKVLRFAFSGGRFVAGR